MNVARAAKEEMTVTNCWCGRDGNGVWESLL